MFHPIDELPFWSAPFGLTLLGTVRIKTGLTILDIGCGNGFPLLELAERAGSAGRIVGLDPSPQALDKAREKIAINSIKNVYLTEGIAERMPFDNSFFDLITSNNGLNNVSDLTKSLAECFRVAKPGAQMVVTMNLPGTMIEFYRIFGKVLRENSLETGVERMHRHISEKRKSSVFLIQAIRQSGFKVITAKKEQFTIQYADGSAFLNHSLIRNGFRTPWMSILPPGRTTEIFHILEYELNRLSEKHGCFWVTVPYICIDSAKPV